MAAHSQKLHLGDGFDLPVDVATGSTGILATKGAGKSNAAVVMAEEMFKAGIPFVAVDPKGDWHGLRAGGDGGPGLPIPVFGGRHGDIPLESTAGALIAELVLKHRLTCVLDVSQFDKAETTRFLLAFARYLFAHCDDDGAEPLHLFLEEAHEYLPQVVKGDQAHLVGMWQKIVKQGRFKGLGVTMISQRSAVLNKDVLELIDTLIVLRTIGPLSRKAIGEWVKGQDVDPKLLDSLPSLKDGEAWVWSPGALGLMERVQFRRRHTFDSGATPKVGEKRRAPGTIADVDLGAIKDAMADTIEKAKADDPRELRSRIKSLEADLQTAQRIIERERAEAKVEIQRVEVTKLPMGSRLAVATIVEHAEKLMGALRGLGVAFDKYDEDQREPVTPPPPAAPAPAPRPTRTSRPVKAPDSSTESVPVGALSKAERTILSVLAQFPAGRTQQQLAMLSGYSGKSGGFKNALSKLRTSGLINRGQPIVITEFGLEVMDGNYEPLPHGRALLEHWLGVLSKAEREILTVLVAAWPGTMTHTEVADATEYSPSSGGFKNALSRLRTLQLISGYGSGMRADDTLAQEANG